MRWMVLGAACLALLGCSKGQPQRPTEKLTTFDAAPTPSGAPPAPTSGAPAPITVSLPQIAYSYKYGFRLPEGAIAHAQAAHMALCDRLGPARCQLVGMQSGGGDDEAANATLKLRVASTIALAFGQALQAAVAQAGGRSVSSSIGAEDVSKAIVDTDARLAQRTLLVERLTGILRTHAGKVSELVEAERSVAAAQEEIDQAKGELADLRGRVAMSAVEISYGAVTAAPDESRTGLGDAAAQSWSAFAFGVAMLVRLVIFLLPWALLAGLGWLGVRAWRGRIKGRSDTI